MKTKINIEIGSMLRDLRVKKGLTLEQVAKKLGITKNTVSYLELGYKKITVEELKEYCSILGTDISTILNDFI